MTRHPAKFSDAMMPLLCELLIGKERVLDPFGGTSKLKQVMTTARVFTGEIEWEWAKMGADTVSDALNLPYAAGSFDCVCTSPTYGNRMADHHEAKDGSRRNTYRHSLGRMLHPDNSGQLQWGDKYREFHLKAWREVKRVLESGGTFILNVSDHIRAGERMRVSDWHATTLNDMGFAIKAFHEIETPRNRFGANANLRVGAEYVYVWQKGD